MKISFVKKITTDGNPCKKCAEVHARLEKDGLLDRIDEIIIADERDPKSAGMQLAAQYIVARAPFFIVEQPGVDPIIYTIYFQFVNEVLNRQTSEQEAAKDLLDANPDLDFL